MKKVFSGLAALSLLLVGATPASAMYYTEEYYNVDPYSSEFTDYTYNYEEEYIDEYDYQQDYQEPTWEEPSDPYYSSQDVYASDIGLPYSLLDWLTFWDDEEVVNEQPRTVAILGDSLGSGVGASSYEYTIAGYLEQNLDNQDSLFVETLANSGATVQDVLENQVPQIEQMNVDDVILVVGANDVTRLTSRQNFWERWNMVLDRLENYGTNVVVVTIPYLAEAPVIPQYLQEAADYRTQDFNFLIEEAARDRQNVQVFDLYSYSSEVLDQRQDLYSSDGFHPNDRGYQLLSKELVKYL